MYNIYINIHVYVFVYLYTCVCIENVPSRGGILKGVATLKSTQRKALYLYSKIYNAQVSTCTLSVASTNATMGRLRSVGSFKLYVSFAEYSLLYRAFL